MVALPPVNQSSQEKSDENHVPRDARPNRQRTYYSCMMQLSVIPKMFTFRDWWSSARRTGNSAF